MASAEPRLKLVLKSRLMTVLRVCLRKNTTEKMKKHNPTKDSGKHDGLDFRELREPGSDQIFHGNSCQ